MKYGTLRTLSALKALFLVSVSMVKSIITTDLIYLQTGQ